jgi:hypothetical protein
LGKNAIGGLHENDVHVVMLSGRYVHEHVEDVVDVFWE